ncbi:UxaA family hydrolase [Bacillus sp. FJAT-29790]|uniref:UxaA family hydrolase n=1 Tax=Bacillus sp. FJAT-29790 TaxID=1895002 RepID=UPI001C215779|nr:UxaA family hydrolase [Bacillus sp. FJAT-29790]MBU8877581.1 UxaA family hydrolase [Bacillus sp. FJAT-29790]
MIKNYKTILMKPEDLVATALENIPANAIVTVSCRGKNLTIELLEDIEFGHKFAVTLITEGTDILKYGEVIGRASQNIEPGAHVHVHNIEGIRGRGDQIEINK